MTRKARLLAAAAPAVLALILIGSATTQDRTPPAAKHGTAAVPAPGWPRPPTPAPQAVPGSPASSHAASGPQPPSPASSSAPAQAAPGPPALPAPFRLAVHTAAEVIDVPVAPFNVASHQPVDPPHHTAQQWNTAAWIVQSSYPTRPGAGTAYIYGHACQGFSCVFNDLVDTRVGDTAQITVGPATLTYRVDRIGLGPKNATALPDWAANSAVPNRIVLVTCQYQADGSSPNNLIVIADLLR